MKVAIILAIALAVILAVQEAEASCASRCKSRCRARRCKYYVSVRYGWFCYCKCLRCASEQTIKFPENEGGSQMFQQMDGMNNMNTNEHMQQGETEQQGETDM
uniref:Mytilin 3 n=1 Tax=Trichomya hirsuta TaxID=40252 RepID=A0A6B9XR26_9BIVA|nr:mytilin 3 [Trichomya hirsuta]